MRICEEEFLWNLKGSVVVKLPAYDIIKTAMNEREAFHPSKEIVFVETSCPWKDHLFDIEAEEGCKGQVKFLIGQDQRKLWKIMTVPPKAMSFDMRVPLCKAWRGLRSADLAKASGVEDAEFVHMAGFIGGAWSKESAIKMAELSLAEHKEVNDK